MNLQDSVTILKGIGPKKAEIFAHQGITTVEDLIFTFPRLYEDRRHITPIDQLNPSENALFIGTVDTIKPNAFKSKGKRVFSMLISDDTGSIEVVFFNANYLAKTVHIGDKFSFYGKPIFNQKSQRLQVVHPEFEKAENAQVGILPIYPLSSGISQREMRNIQKRLEPYYVDAESILKEDTIKRNNLCSLEYAIRNVHFPSQKKSLLEGKYRLIFDEFIVLETGLLAYKINDSDMATGVSFGKAGVENQFIDSLSYPLTSAQKRCVNEIIIDLEAKHQMNRLIQGDVGSGKTVVAEIAIYKAVKNGFQAVLMAPTEILAHQHYINFKEDFADKGITVGFLSGNMRAAEKRQILKEIEDGSIQILIGTHAVIQPDVSFNNLGIVITDEQHRFGVNQRIKLKEKGENPNILVMTATPIPRTLAVVLYGDMDVSVIDEMPPGRQPVKTFCIESDLSRNKCYDFVSQQIEQGHQAYVVTPLIDESETMDAKSAQQVYDELKKRFSRIEIIHGGMKQSEKDEIMQRFNDGTIDVLVATVVIEVGINVPNATVMIIENAERFGLAQLHQLRGRVGRGKWQSYCYLILGSDSQLALKRGKIMEESSDGFYIAEEDLKIRGPGEIFGTRQHGIPDMKLADMVRHMDVLTAARDEACAILKDDPLLEKNENKPLKRRVIKLFGDDFSLNL